jgi:hypothetical protein
MTIEAKPVVKNKFWIIEEDGNKIATLQANDKNVVLVKDQQRIAFDNLLEIETKYKIKFAKWGKSARTKENIIAEFPTDSTPYNVLYDVRKKIPIYTKTRKSKSFFCAGWYLIRYENNWGIEFCPKKIFIERNEYLGPYANRDQVLEKLNSISR